MSIKLNTLLIVVIGVMLLFVYIFTNTGIAEAADTMWWTWTHVFPERHTGSSGWAKAFCPSDRQISGGGFIIDDNLFILSSVPIQEGNQDGWFARAYESRLDGVPNSITAYAVCVK